MVQILTAAKTPAERAAVVAARAAGIPYIVRQPRRSGPGRRSYCQCLQQNASAADGNMILGDRVPPYTTDVRLILECGKPATAVAAGVAMQLGGATSTRKWLRRHRINTLHVTGTAPKAVAAKFLQALLRGQ